MIGHANIALKVRCVTTGANMIVFLPLKMWQRSNAFSPLDGVPCLTHTFPFSLNLQFGNLITWCKYLRTWSAVSFIYHCGMHNKIVVIGASESSPAGPRAWIYVLWCETYGTISCAQAYISPNIFGFGELVMRRTALCSGWSTQWDSVSIFMIRNSIALMECAGHAINHRLIILSFSIFRSGHTARYQGHEDNACSHAHS